MDSKQTGQFPCELFSKIKLSFSRITDMGGNKSRPTLFLLCYLYYKTSMIDNIHNCEAQQIEQIIEH